MAEIDDLGVVLEGTLIEPDGHAADFSGGELTLANARLSDVAAALIDGAASPIVARPMAGLPVQVCSSVLPRSSRVMRDRSGPSTHCSRVARPPATCEFLLGTAA